MNLIITGGAGFIGLNLIVKLIKIKRKLNVFILDNFENSSKKNIFFILKNLNYKKKIYNNCVYINNKKIFIVKIDLKKLTINNSIFKKKIFAIIHLAAQTGVQNSIENPELDAEKNILYTIRILEICRKLNIRKMIFASSIGVLGNSINQNTNNIPNPISPYACSKYSSENYLRIYKELYNIDTFSLRFSNVYGKYSFNKNSAIVKFIRNILNNKYIEINGDGKQSRDFIYVEDLCEIISKILFIKKVKFNDYLTINIATGKTTSINKIVEIFSKNISDEKNLKIKIKKKKPISGEIKVSKPSIVLLNKIIGKYNFISVNKGIIKTFEWWKEFYYSDKKI